MRILWCGDSPTISTGFGKCTRFACEELHAAGHDISVLGINYAGDPHSYPYPIYPCMNTFDGGYDAIGVSRLPRMIEKLNPDLIIILLDPWQIQLFHHSIDTYNAARVKGGTTPLIIPPMIGWIAVDAKNQWDAPYLNRLSHVMVWTEFARDELVKGGYIGDCSIVPLGVDTEQFHPCDQHESRLKLAESGLWPIDKDNGQPIIPFDSFVIGVVGRNQPRKRLDLVFEYFAELVHTHTLDNAVLYLHVAPTGEKGTNIRALTRYYNLGNRVILSQPDIGVGVDESIMKHVYSSFDVYLSLAHAEGWNLCAHEAMACGIPTVCPDQGGFASWSKGAAITIPCTSSCLSAPLNDHPYTIGGIADRAETVSMLKSLYDSPASRQVVGWIGRRQAESFTWQRSAECLRETLERVMQTINTSSAPEPANV